MGEKSELKSACRKAVSLLANALEKETWLEIASKDMKKTASKKKRISYKKCDSPSTLESGKT